MFNDYEWVFNALLCVALIYVAYIMGYAIFLGVL